jgi:hypothetical protein
MRIKSIGLFLAFILFAIKFYGQQQNSVSVSYIKNNTSDTLWLLVNTTTNTKPGTLLLITTSSISNEADTAYYPLIDTSSAFIITIPKAYQSGILHLQAYYYPEIFAVSGKVLTKIKDKTINVVLLTASKSIYNKAITLTDDKHFTLPGFIFEKKGTIIFNYSSDEKKDHPDVEIEQTPAAKDFSDIVFNQDIVLTTPSITKDSLNQPAKNLPGRSTNATVTKDSTDRKFKSLNNVTVKGIRKTRAQQFNDQFSTGLFRDPGEKIVDVMDNPSAQSFPDCLSYLRSQIAGLQVSTDKFGDNIMMWRGHETKAFYIDEIPVDIDELLTINVTDIAIIKAYPPTATVGLGNGDGGAIAIYTRRGEYRSSNTTDNKWIYSIKGYSPAERTLFSTN